jgi:hypothetical protein
MAVTARPKCASESRRLFLSQLRAASPSWNGRQTFASRHDPQAYLDRAAELIEAEIAVFYREVIERVS